MYSNYYTNIPVTMTLILILIFWVGTCAAISNNFVIEMLEERSKEFKQEFRVYWNVPTMQCASKKIPFENLYEKFGIIQNRDDRFNGDKITILYETGEFPKISKNISSGQYDSVNGGVPQEGNLEEHLVAFRERLVNKIPDPYFDGIGVIDFEDWRPVFVHNFGSLNHYRSMSIDIEKERHSWWRNEWIKKEAALRFETAARKFMETTLIMAKDLRPNALWGYYGFPYCFNMRERDMKEDCVTNIPGQNDGVYWLWAESTALFPSVYSSKRLSFLQLSSHIKGRVKESARVRLQDTPILPYFWFKYRDAGFFSEEDLTAALDTLYHSEASGLIIWGSSKDVNTVDKCYRLYKYVETVLGPNIAKYTKQRSRISNLINNNSFGNSDIPTTEALNDVEVSTIETSTEYEDVTTSDQTTQSFSNEEIFSKESSIFNNEYTYEQTTVPLDITQEFETYERTKHTTNISPTLVSTEDVSYINNYKSVEGGGGEPHMKESKKEFRVYWNVPTMQCASKKIPFENLYEKFGIIQNEEDRFDGDKITILYETGEFPKIFKNISSGQYVLVNGGVPQEGNLEEHLAAFRERLLDKIPDPLFDGIGVVDFEDWRPVFDQNFGSLNLYRSMSFDIEKERHSWWRKEWIEKEAALRFETAARKFMETTLIMAKDLRPNALWGYYGFPYCFNMRERDMKEDCVTNIPGQNDGVYWLWAESTALFPSVYSSKRLSFLQLSSHIKGRVKESARVRLQDTPILPYFWFKYRDAGFFSEEDLTAALDTLYHSEASGLIIWGSSKDVNTVDKCYRLYKYVETVLGPNIAKYTKQRSRISNLINNNSFGNSDIPTTEALNDVEVSTIETSTEYEDVTTSDQTTQSFSNEEIFSKESSIFNNEYTSEQTDYITRIDTDEDTLIIVRDFDTKQKLTTYNNMLQEQFSTTQSNDIGVENLSIMDGLVEGDTNTEYDYYDLNIIKTRNRKDNRIYLEAHSLIKNVNNDHSHKEVIYSDEIDNDNLIVVNNNNIRKESFKPHEYSRNTYFDNDYLIIPKEFADEQQSYKSTDNIGISETQNDFMTESTSLSKELSSTESSVDNFNDVDFESIVNKSKKDNISFDSVEEESDYLIIVNHDLTDINTYKPSEYTESADTNDDYLIIAKDVTNEPITGNPSLVEISTNSSSVENFFSVPETMDSSTSRIDLDDVTLEFSVSTDKDFDSSTSVDNSNLLFTSREKLFYPTLNTSIQTDHMTGANSTLLKELNSVENFKTTDKDYEELQVSASNENLYNDFYTPGKELFNPSDEIGLLYDFMVSTENTLSQNDAYSETYNDLDIEAKEIDRVASYIYSK